MTRLVEHSALSGRECRHGTCRLVETTPGPITLLALYPGARDAMSECLMRTVGAKFPAPGRVETGQGARLVWAGREQAFLIGDHPDSSLSAHGCVSDQTDGWAALVLTGTQAADVLARLTPLDLRPVSLGPGQTARSLLGHMIAHVTPVADGFEILVWRSMARTAVHEIEAAMKGVAARG